MSFIGEYLRQARDAKKLKQRELADEVRAIVRDQVSHNDVSKMETGKIPITPERWRAIIAILDMPKIQAWRIWGLDRAQRYGGISLGIEAEGPFIPPVEDPDVLGSVKGAAAAADFAAENQPPEEEEPPGPRRRNRPR